MPTPSILPAKSSRGGQPCLSLERHLRDTDDVVVSMFDPARRWGNRWWDFFRLNGEQRECCWLSLRVAALLHDLGKANEDFVAAVGSSRAPAQTLRHEHVGALLLHLPSLRGWLGSNPAIDVPAVTAAVLSHHLKASREGEWRWCQHSRRPSLLLYLGHPDVARVLARVADVAALPPPPPQCDLTWREAAPWTAAYADGLSTASRLAREIRGDDARARFVAALKAGLIVADSVASALVREGHAISRWIDDVVHRAALTSADVASAIIRPRVEALERRSKSSFVWHRFQDGAAALGPRALILASCGAGKTLAAWRWAQAQAAGGGIGRVIFLYPTRGTATEGFRDYVGWAPEDESALVHGTARYELESMAENPSEAVSGKVVGLSEADARLFALGLWSRRYFSATVDQFLGFLEHSYTSLCLLPALADAAVIIDEVHSFDRRMFDGLVSFLRTFDVPVLCMTATLPPSRRRELEAAGLSSYPRDVDRDELADLESAECRPRYAIERLEGEDAALERVLAASGDGRRVLWVVNVVARAQDLARRLEARLGREVLCYHSRFRLKDRKRVHDATVHAFKDPSSSRVAVTTQVCEMSLDLDADVLVTEVAPVPALVQRMGRANRHGNRGVGYRAPVLVYPPASTAPYERADVEAGAAFVSELAGRMASQRDLAAALERHVPAERAADGSTRFLESGYFAVPGSFRDGQEHGRPALLDSDLDVAHRGGSGPRLGLEPYLVTVPFRWLVADFPRPAWLPSYVAIASGARYDERFGFDTTTSVEGDTDAGQSTVK